MLPHLLEETHPIPERGMVINDFIDWYRKEYINSGNIVKDLNLHKPLLTQFLEGTIGVYGFYPQPSSSAPCTHIIHHASGKTIPLPAGIKYVEEHDIGKAYLFDQNWSILEAKLVDVIEEDSFNLQKRFDKALGASPSLCLFIFSLLDSWSSIDC